MSAQRKRPASVIRNDCKAHVRQELPRCRMHVGRLVAEREGYDEGGGCLQGHI